MEGLREVDLPEVGAAETFLRDKDFIMQLEEAVDAPVTEESRRALCDPVENPFRFALKQDWIMLFRNACAAVQLKAPWNFITVSDAERTAMMKRIVTIFTQEYIATEEDKQKVKAVLKELKAQNHLAEVQSLLIAYKVTQNDIWTRYDSYRKLSGDNFIHEEDHAQFKKHCTDTVGDRLRDIQSSLSEDEEKKNAARSLWASIHSDTSCFGSSITVALHSIEADDPGVLPHKCTVSCELVVGDAGYGEIEVNRHAKRSKAHCDKLTFGPNDESVAVGLFAGSSLKAEQAQIVFKVRKPPSFGCMSAQELDQFIVPAVMLYHNIEPFDSVKRAKEFAGQAGAHLCCLSIPNLSQTMRLNVSLWMRCGTFTHENVPFAFDAASQPATTADQMAENELRSDRACAVWTVDHHAAAIRLLDLFGQLNDEEYMAFQLYCDRYLIHKELFEVGMLTVTATRLNFTDRVARDDSLVAVERLMQIRASLATRTCSGMAESAIDLAREQSVGRLLRLEEEVDAEDAPHARLVAITILERTGLSSDDLMTLFERRIRRGADIVVKRLQTITSALGETKPQQSKSIGGGPTAASADAAILLIETGPAASKDPRARLTNKTAALFRVVSAVLQESTAALEHGTASSSRAVLALAESRTKFTLDQITGPFRNCVLAVWRELARSLEPVNPFGDSLGLLAHLYQTVISFVDRVANQYPALEGECDALADVFDDFLVNWISLIQRKIYFWVESSVHQTDLVAQDKGYLHHNTAANDVLQMFDEVFRFFAEMSRLGDPSREEVTVPKFCSLLQEFSEHFAIQMIAKAKVASGLSASTFEAHLYRWLVCYSTLQHFYTLLSSFWTRNVNGDLLRDEGFYDAQMVLAKTAVILGQTKASLVQTIDGFRDYLLDQVLAWAVAYLGVSNSATPGLAPVDFCRAVHDDFLGVLYTVAENVEQRYHGELLLRCVRVLFAAFDKRVVGQTTKPLGDAEKELDLAIATTLETVSLDFAKGFGLPELDVLGLIRSSRQLVTVCSRPSSDLVASLNDRNNQTALSAKESEMIHLALSARKDSDAERYIRTLPKR